MWYLSSSVGSYVCLPSSFRAVSTHRVFWMLLCVEVEVVVGYLYVLGGGGVEGNAVFSHSF